VRMYLDIMISMSLKTQQLSAHKGLSDWENELTDTSIKPLSSFEDYMTDNGIVSVSLGDTLRQGLGLYLD